MADTSSSLKLGVDTSEALTNLQTLSAELDKVKGKMASMGGLDGLKAAQGDNAMLRTLKSIRREVTNVHTAIEALGKSMSGGFARGSKSADGMSKSMKKILADFKSGKIDAEAFVQKLYSMDKGTIAVGKSFGKLHAESKIALDGTGAKLRGTLTELGLTARAADQLALSLMKAAAAKRALAATPEGQTREALATLARRRRLQNNAARQLKELGVVGTQTVTPSPRAVEAYTHSANRARMVTQAHAASMRDAHSAARGLAGGFHAMWLTWGNIAPLLAGFALSSGIREAVSTFADVQYQLTFVKALAEDADYNIEQMGESMLETAAVLGVSAGEAGEALRVLAQAGLNVEDSQRALPTVFKLATVGETSVKNAAIAATGAMHAFGLEIGHVSTISDSLVKAGALSATSVDQMMESMKMAAPTAHQFNVSLEDTAALLTVLAKSNITGTKAGTAVKNMIKEMAAPASELNRKIMEALDFSAYDEKGGLKPVFEQISDLKDAIKEFDRESQNSILVKLFGERGDKAFFSAANMKPADLSFIRDGMDDATGYTAEVFFQLQQTVKGQWDLLKADFSKTFAEIGAESEGPIRDMMKGIRETLNDPEVQSGLRGLVQSVAKLGEVALRYGPEVLAFFAIWAGGTFVATSIAAATTAMSGLSGMLKGTAATAGAAAAATTTLGTASRTAAGGAAALGAATRAIIPMWMRLVGVLISVAGAYLLLKQRKDSLAQSSINELSNLKDIEKGLADEVKRKREEIALLEKDKDPSLATSNVAKDKAQEAVDALKAQQLSIVKAIEAVKEGRFKGDTSLVNVKEYQRISQELMLAEERLNNIKAHQEELNKLNARNKEIIAEKDAKARKEFEKNNPAGTKKFDVDALKDDNSANRMANSLARADISDILEDYRSAERMAKAHFDNEVKLAKLAHDQKLIDANEYLDRLNAAKAKYDGTVGGAKETLEAKFAKVNVPAEDLSALRERMDLEVKRIENNNKLLDQQAAMNALFQLEQDAMRSMGDDKKQIEDTLPKMAAEADRKRMLEATTEQLRSLEGVELEVALARQAARNEYEKDITVMQQEIKMLDDIIARAQRLIDLGPERVGKDVFDNAEKARDKAVEKRGSKAGALEATQKAADEQENIAGALTKNLSLTKRWNAALKESQDIATKLGSAFGKTGTAIGGAMTAVVRLGAAQEKIQARLAARTREAGFDPVKLKEAETMAAKESAEAQMAMFGDLTSAAKGFFEEGTTGYKAMHAAEQVFRAFELAQAMSNMAVKLGLMQTDLVTYMFGEKTKVAAGAMSTQQTVMQEGIKQKAKGATAVANQATEGDPYTAWARMAAMVAALAAIGIMIGGGGGGGSPRSAKDIQKERQRKQSTGTVLGDPDAKSKSIDNSLKLLTDNSGIGLTHTNAMRFALENIKDNIGNFGRVIAKAAGLQMNPNLSISGNSFGVSKGFLGFSKTTRELLGQGITQMRTGNAWLGNIMRGHQLQLEKFQQIRTTKTKWWGLSRKTSTSMEYADAGNPLEKAISGVMKSLGEGILEAGVALGRSRQNLMAQLEKTWFNIGSIDFTGMTASEKEQALTDRISQVGDMLINHLIPGMDRFAKAGEGLLETAFRVASSIEVAKHSLAEFGIEAVHINNVKRKNTGDLSAEIVRDSIVRKESTFTRRHVTEWGESPFGGMAMIHYRKTTQHVNAIGKIMQDVNGSAKELLDTYRALKDAQKALSTVGLGTISTNLIAGAGGLEKLNSSLRSYTDNFFEPAEKARRQQWMLTKEIEKMGVKMPKSKEEFRTLVESLMRAGGKSAELAGRLLALSDDVADALDNPAWKVKAKEDLEKQTAIVDALTDSVNSFFNAMKAGKDILKRIDTALLPEGQQYDNSGRMREIWTILSKNTISYEQQMELAGELADLSIEKYQTDKENAKELIEFAKGLKGYLSDLLTGDLAPQTTAQKLATAQAQFNETLAKARAGDETAKAELTGKADTLLQLAREYHASSDAYAQIFDNVYGSLDQVQAAANAHGQAMLAGAENAQHNELMKIRELVAQRTDAANQNYEKQLHALNQALWIQKNIELKLGMLTTLPEQINGLPAEIAYRLGKLFPNLPNHNPAYGMDAPGGGKYGGGIRPGSRPIARPGIPGIHHSIGRPTFGLGKPSSWIGSMKPGVWGGPFGGGPVKPSFGLDDPSSWYGPIKGGGNRPYMPTRPWGMGDPSSMFGPVKPGWGKPWGTGPIKGGGKRPYMPTLDLGMPQFEYRGMGPAGDTMLGYKKIIDQFKAGAAANDKAAEEVKQLRALVERMMNEQREHTATLVRAQYDSTDNAAEKIVDGHKEAVDNAVWKDKNEPHIR